MTYNELSKEIEQLHYRDKLRLAQLLIQLARKEEEDKHPEQRHATSTKAELDPALIRYVGDRLRRLRPSKKEALFNSISAMFQFQGGVSDVDKKRIFLELQKARYIDVRQNGRIHTHKANIFIGLQRCVLADINPSISQIDFWGRNRVCLRKPANNPTFEASKRCLVVGCWGSLYMI